MSRILTESGGLLLEEDGVDHLLIDTPNVAFRLLQENGSFILQQDGTSRLIYLTNIGYVSQAGLELLLPNIPSFARIAQIGLEVLVVNSYVVVVSPQNPQTVVGRTIQFTAQAVNGLGQVKPILVTWTCGSTGTINGLGLFTATSPGPVVVTATEHA